MSDGASSKMEKEEFESEYSVEIDALEMLIKLLKSGLDFVKDLFWKII